MEMDGRKPLFILNKKKLAGCVANVFAQKSPATPTVSDDEVSLPCVPAVEPSIADRVESDLERIFQEEPASLSLCIASVRGQAEDLDPFRMDEECGEAYSEIPMDEVVNVQAVDSCEPTTAPVDTTKFEPMFDLLKSLETLEVPKMAPPPVKPRFLELLSSDDDFVEKKGVPRLKKLVKKSPKKTARSSPKKTSKSSSKKTSMSSPKKARKKENRKSSAEDSSNVKNGLEGSLVKSRSPEKQREELLEDDIVEKRIEALFEDSGVEKQTEELLTDGCEETLARKSCESPEKQTEELLNDVVEESQKNLEELPKGCLDESLEVPEEPHTQRDSSEESPRLTIEEISQDTTVPQPTTTEVDCENPQTKTFDESRINDSGPTAMANIEFCEDSSGSSSDLSESSGPDVSEQSQDNIRSKIILAPAKLSLMPTVENPKQLSPPPNVVEPTKLSSRPNILEPAKFSIKPNVVAPAKLSLKSAEELKKKKNGKDSRNNLGRKKSNAKSSEMLAHIQEEAQNQRINQDFPGYNWLERKIMSGNMSYNPPKPPARRNSTHLPISAPPQRTNSSIRPVARLLPKPPTKPSLSNDLPTTTKETVVKSPPHNTNAQTKLVVPQQELVGEPRVAAPLDLAVPIKQEVQLETTEPSDDVVIIEEVTRNPKQTKSPVLAPISPPTLPPISAPISPSTLPLVSVPISPPTLPLVSAPISPPTLPPISMPMLPSVLLATLEPISPPTISPPISPPTLSPISNADDCDTPNLVIDESPTPEIPRKEVPRPDVQPKTSPEPVPVVKPAITVTVRSAPQRISPEVSKKSSSSSPEESRSVETRLAEIQKRASYGTPDDILSDEKQLDMEYQLCKSEVDVLDKMARNCETERANYLRMKKEKELTLRLMEIFQKTYTNNNPPTEAKKRSPVGATGYEVPDKKMKEMDPIANLQMSFGMKNEPVTCQAYTHPVATGRLVESYNQTHVPNQAQIAYSTHLMERQRQNTQPTAYPGLSNFRPEVTQSQRAQVIHRPPARTVNAPVYSPVPQQQRPVSTVYAPVAKHATGSMVPSRSHRQPLQNHAGNGVISHNSHLAMQNGNYGNVSGHVYSASYAGERTMPRQGVPVYPGERTNPQQTVPVYPERTNSRQTVPVYPERTNPRQTVPVYPERTNPRQTVPVYPERTNSGLMQTPVSPAWHQPQVQNYQHQVPNYEVRGTNYQNTGYQTQQYPQVPVPPAYQAPVASRSEGNYRSNESIAKPDLQLFCYHCQQKATLMCSKCKTVCYCSHECQVANWRIHEPRCTRT